MDRQYDASGYSHKTVQLPPTLSLRGHNSGVASTSCAFQNESDQYLQVGTQELPGLCSNAGAEVDYYFNGRSDPDEGCNKCGKVDRVDVGVQKCDLEQELTATQTTLSNQVNRDVSRGVYEFLCVREAVESICATLDHLADAVNRIEDTQTSILKRLGRRRRYSQYLID